MIQDCQFCPYIEYSANAQRQLGYGVKNRLMFIGRSPSFMDSKQFKKAFQDLLSKVDVTKEDYYFTNLVKTIVPKEEVLTKEIVEHCMSHINEEIKLIIPQVIFLMGKDTREAFGIRYPLTMKSKIFWTERGRFNTLLYSIPSPSSLYYHPEQEEDYLKLLNKGLKHYKPILL